MSYYYNYYIGYKKDNKIYPLGPYSCDGKINEVLSRSRSFASDLHDDFHKIPDEMISSELRRDFEYENFNGEKIVDVKYLELDKMSDDNFIKSGYFLIEDVQSYLKDKDTEDIFYEYLEPAVYTMKMENELKFGKPETKYDVEGNPFSNYSCGDYTYFAYPDYHCKEYESFIIKQQAYIYEYTDVVKDAEIVILETEG